MLLNTLKKKKNVYIHIGFMKTGTSAIQEFLVKNTKLLEENDFYYPTMNRKAMNYLGFSLLDEIPKHVHHTLDIKKRELYTQLKQEIDKAKQRNILLSSEAFSLMSTERFVGKEMPKYLREVFSAKKYNVKIIAIVRRQDEYLESQYNQHVKTHDFWTLYTDTIENFYREKKELFNFNFVLKKWVLFFGVDSMIVEVYDKQKNSVAQFLSLLGIQESKKSESVSIYKNQSLSFKALEFMRKANSLNIIKDTASQNYKLIELIEASLNDKQKARLLKNGEREKIMEECKLDNEELSKCFLNGDMTWMNKNIEISETEMDTITINDCIKITTDIWSYFQNKQ
jgi:hypothetical protein